MLRIFHQYVAPELVPAVTADSAIILASIAAAAWTVNAPALRAGSLVAWAGKVAAFALLCQFGLHLGDLYEIGARGRELVDRLLRGLAWSALLTAALWLLVPAMRLGSGWLVLALPGIGALVLIWRLGLDQMGWRSAPGERVLLVGRRAQWTGVMQQVALRPELGVRIVGIVEGTTTAELEAWVRLHQPDRVVVNPAAPGQRLMIGALMPLERTGIVIERQNSFAASLTGRVPAIAGVWQHHANPQQSGAPVLSMCAGGLALLLAVPLMALIAAAIKLDSRGPVLYRQERVGLGGTRFRMLKFRSMRPDAERGSGPVWAQVADPRATRVGRLLRTARLDELPQLWNVARGEMTLVGPRPERPAFVACLAAEIPHYQHRHSVRPGITGWAQVRYPYGETAADAHAKLEYDLFYLAYFSLGLELFVLLQTIKTMLLGRGAR